MTINTNDTTKKSTLAAQTPPSETPRQKLTDFACAYFDCSSPKYLDELKSPAKEEWRALRAGWNGAVAALCSSGMGTPRDNGLDAVCRVYHAKLHQPETHWTYEECRWWPCNYEGKLEPTKEKL